MMETVLDHSLEQNCTVYLGLEWAFSTLHELLVGADC